MFLGCVLFETGSTHMVMFLGCLLLDFGPTSIRNIHHRTVSTDPKVLPREAPLASKAPEDTLGGPIPSRPDPLWIHMELHDFRKLNGIHRTSTASIEFE